MKEMKGTYPPMRLAIKDYVLQTEKANRLGIILKKCVENLNILDKKH